MNQREIDIAQQQWLVSKAVGRCLHVGSGMKRIPWAVNIDPNPERWHGLADVAADARCLPFQDGVFDSVVSSHVLPIFGDIKKALREMARVMCVGGRMAHVVPDLCYAPSRASSHHQFEKQFNGWHGPKEFQIDILGLEDVLLVTQLENFKEFCWSFKFEAVKL